MSLKVRALVSQGPKDKLSPFTYDLPDLGPEHVDVEVLNCGLCHSDLSMNNNDWGITKYPFVPGHEIIGKVINVGASVKNVKKGDMVGVGWFSGSCMHCPHCMGGDHNLCDTREETIVGRYGGFASHVRAHWSWTILLPKNLDTTKAGPLFCGGITVFNPIIQQNIKPTDRVAVIGIGGLGHMALQFLNKWGCEVTAFTSSPAKAKEAISLGAHETVDSTSDAAIEKCAGRFDMILNTANADLNWGLYITALAPKGKLHFVGVAPSPVSSHVFPLIGHQKSIAGTPLGSPETVRKMLDFCARHKIAPVTETFKMSQANDAFHHLESGKARYRIVLDNDL